MKKKRGVIEFAVLLSLAPSFIGQNVPTVNQTAEESSCVNIVALSGAKIDCSNLTSAQKKSLADIPAILKLALENKDYYDAIMAKLAELSKAQSGPTTGPIFQGPCGVVLNGGSNNSASPNCAPPERHLTDEQKKAISDALNGKQIIVHVGYMVNVPDALDYANELCDAIKEGIPSTNCGDVWAMVQEGRGSPWYGIKFTYKGDPIPQGQPLSISQDSPAGTLIHAMQAAGLNKGAAHADPTMKDNEVTLIVGPPPKG